MMADMAEEMSQFSAANGGVPGSGAASEVGQVFRVWSEWVHGCRVECILWRVVKRELVSVSQRKSMKLCKVCNCAGQLGGSGSNLLVGLHNQWLRGAAKARRGACLYGVVYNWYQSREMYQQLS